MEKVLGARRNVICVAGMPRSGTSLLTQMLHRCGLDLGPPEQLMPASPNNTDGFWENLRFVRLNERLLAANGGSWCSPPATLRATPQITAEAQSILAQFEGREPWGWKDPRNALTLPFWKSLLPSMKVIVCVRHPAETAASLAASNLIQRRRRPLYWALTRPGSPVRMRGGASRLHRRVLGVARTLMSAQNHREFVHELGLELWRIYNTRILDETRAGDRLVMHYDAVLTNPRAELERVVAFAGLRVAPAVLDEAARVASSRLRHQRADEEALNPELAALYAQLSRERQSQ